MSGASCAGAPRGIQSLVPGSTTEKWSGASIAQTPLVSPKLFALTQHREAGWGIPVWTVLVWGGGDQECDEFSQSSELPGHLSGQPVTSSRSPGEVSCGDLELFL